MDAKIAIPMAGGKLSLHFGHSEQFAVITIKNNEVVREELLTPPEHVPGAYPEFLAYHGVTDVIVGGIGQRAIDIFKRYGIDVKTGAQKKTMAELTSDFINDKLITGDNSCDSDHHEHEHDHEHHHHGHHGFSYN